MTRGSNTRRRSLTASVCARAAKRCRIALDTAFRWRHRFLKSAKDRKAESVSGIVEADETYFLRSQKGARKVKGRAPRKRGGKASKPGLSDEHTPVLIARDRTGATTDTMLDKVDTESIARHLAPIVAKDTLLISDGEKALKGISGRRLTYRPTGGAGPSTGGAA